MNNPRLAFEVGRYKAVRDQLLADHADDIDEETLADTTEGLTDLHELLIAIVRGAIDDEDRIEMLKAQIKDKQRRIERFELRKDRRRALVRDAMMDAGIHKLSSADFTAAIRNGSPHVVITDEQLIPESFVSYRPHIDKRGILDALKNGPVDGAALSNPEMILSVRTQ